MCTARSGVVSRERATHDRLDTTIFLTYLNAVFDAIYHNIIFVHLQQRIDIEGVSFRWIRSYSCGRIHNYIINRVSSNETTLISGVRQFSLLVPSLCYLLVQPICNIIRKHAHSHPHYGMPWVCNILTNKAQVLFVFQPMYIFNL